MLLDELFALKNLLYYREYVGNGTAYDPTAGSCRDIQHVQKLTLVLLWVTVQESVRCLGSLLMGEILDVMIEMN